MCVCLAGLRLLETKSLSIPRLKRYNYRKGQVNRVAILKRKVSRFRD